MTFCPDGNAYSSRKFDFLLNFFDLNEAAFAYHRHCLAPAEKISPAFLKTLEIVADELFAQAIEDDPRISPKYIKTKILERRYNLQYSFDYNHMQEGCLPASIAEAKKHYQQLSSYNKTEVHNFIDEQAGDYP